MAKAPVFRLSDLPEHIRAQLPIKPLSKGAPKKRTMNGLERQYAQELEKMVLFRRIKAYRYEAIKLRLADNTSYTPDFLYVNLDGTMELHEVKGGFCREDAWIKLKIAADLFPMFKFYIVKKYAGQWNLKLVSNGEPDHDEAA